MREPLIREVYVRDNSYAALWFFLGIFFCVPFQHFIYPFLEENFLGADIQEFRTGTGQKLNLQDDVDYDLPDEIPMGPYKLMQLAKRGDDYDAKLEYAHSGVDPVYFAVTLDLSGGKITGSLEGEWNLPVEAQILVKPSTKVELTFSGCDDGSCSISDFTQKASDFKAVVNIDRSDSTNGQSNKTWRGVSSH